MIDIDKIIQEKAKERKARIVIAEGWDERVLRAVHDLKDMAHFVLLGNPKTILENVKKWNLDIGKTEIIDHLRSEKKEALTKALFELRKEKGLTLQEAQELIKDVNYFGCMMAYTGEVEGVASSVICPTAEIMRPALQILKKKGVLSNELSVYKDKKNDRILFMSDGSLNINPSSEQLAQIGLNSAHFVKSVGITPKVAFLSFSTKGSGGDGPEVMVVRNAVKLFQDQATDIICDGEMQFDAATNPYSASRKCPDSPLKGDANILIMPNLTAGNILLHALMQQSDSELAYGFALGTIKPVTILGRSTPLETVKGSLKANMMECNLIAHEKK